QFYNVRERLPLRWPVRQIYKNTFCVNQIEGLEKALHLSYIANLKFDVAFQTLALREALRGGDHLLRKIDRRDLHAVSASDFERCYTVTATDFEHAHTVSHKGRENFDFDLLGNDVARAGPLPEAGPVVPKGEHVAVIFNFVLHMPFFLHI